MVKKLRYFRNKFFYFFLGVLESIKSSKKNHTGKGAIICYHRVLPEQQLQIDISPNAKLCVTAKQFDRQLKTIARHYEIVSLNDFAKHVQADSDKFVLAVTFDDGYKDNLEYAMPILQKNNVPATIFVTTRFPEGDTRMWWFELWDYIFNNDLVSVSFENKKAEWTTKSQTEKISCFFELKKWILDLPIKEQWNFLASITQTVERKTYPDLCLTWEEITYLDKHPLIDMEAHSHSHANLKQEDDNSLEFELAECKRLLERHLQRQILHVAYPYGGVEETSVREFTAAAKAGYYTGGTTLFSDITNDQNLFSLPRLVVSNNYTATELIGILSARGEAIRRKIRHQ